MHVELSMFLEGIVARALGLVAAYSFNVLV